MKEKDSEKVGNRLTDTVKEQERLCVCVCAQEEHTHAHSLYVPVDYAYSALCRSAPGCSEGTSHTERHISGRARRAQQRAPPCGAGARVGALRNARMVMVGGGRHPGRGSTVRAPQSPFTAPVHHIDAHAHAHTSCELHQQALVSVFSLKDILVRSYVV